MVEYPLTKANRIKLASVFQALPRVDLSIDCMLEGQMGKVFCDDPAGPSVFVLQTGPFYYFAGNSASPAAEEALHILPPFSLLMPSTPGWIEAAREVHQRKLSELDRYSFSSESLSVDHLARLCRASSPSWPVQRMGRPFCEQVWGQEHFVDLSMYDSVDDFVERGLGYFVAGEDSVVGAAYASLICSQGIEVSVYVEDAYRRQGIATAVASHLLLRCLEHGLAPHWDAANPESCRLALKLGYKPVGAYLAYYLVE